VFSDNHLAELLDPQNYTGLAVEMIDRVLKTLAKWKTFMSETKKNITALSALSIGIGGMIGCASNLDRSDCVELGSNQFR